MGEREFDIYQERGLRGLTLALTAPCCHSISLRHFNETFQWTLPIAKFRRLDQNREKKVEAVSNVNIYWIVRKSRSAIDAIPSIREAWRSFEIQERRRC